MREQTGSNFHLKSYWSVVISAIKQSLFTNAGYLIGVEAINALIGFFFWGLATQLYAPAEIGLASSIISAVALVSLIAGLGTGNGLIRILPESVRPNRMVNSLFLFNIASALLVGGVILVGLASFSPSLSFISHEILLVIGFLAYGITATFAGSLRWTYLALRRASFAFLQAACINGSRLILLIAFTALGVWGLVGSIWLAITVSIFFGYLILLPRAMPEFRPTFTLSGSDLRLILPYSFGVYLAFLLIQAPVRLLPILVLELIGPASAAHAQIAWLVSGILVTPGLALATSAFVEASNSPGSFLRIYSKAGLAGLLTTVFSSLFIFVAANWVLLIFGPSYSVEGSTLLRWLAAAAPLVVLVGIYFSLLRFQKRIKRLVVLSSIVAISTLCSAVLLISNIGISAFGFGWFFGYLMVAIFAIRDILIGSSLSDIKMLLQRSRSLLSTWLSVRGQL